MGDRFRHVIDSAGSGWSVRPVIVNYNGVPTVPCVCTRTVCRDRGRDIPERGAQFQMEPKRLEYVA